MEESGETMSEPSFCRELGAECRAAVPWKLPLFQPESLSSHNLMFIWKSWLFPLHQADHLYSKPGTLHLVYPIHHCACSTLPCAQESYWPCVIPECCSCTIGPRVSEEWVSLCMLTPLWVTPQLYPMTCTQTAETLVPLSVSQPWR